MFGFIKQALKKVYSQCTSKLAGLFARTTLDQETLNELKVLLIAADVGIKPTQMLINRLEEQFKKGLLTSGSDLRVALETELRCMLKPNAHEGKPIIVMVGINGSGKTTFVGKLAHYYKNKGERVLLVAGDTFRAAAVEQLVQWGNRSGVEVVSGTPGQDPASVVYAGCQRFKQEKFDRLIIDTAGRLQTKTNLMKELEKIRRVIGQHANQDDMVTTYLTIDAMLGQNSLEQARLFHESTKLDGIVLTKMDGTGKGGVVFAINDSIGVPVSYISYGEGINDFKAFDADQYVHELIYE